MSGIILGKVFYADQAQLREHQQHLEWELTNDVTHGYSNPFPVLPNSWEKQDQVQRIKMYFENHKEEN